MYGPCCTTFPAWLPQATINHWSPLFHHPNLHRCALVMCVEHAQQSAHLADIIAPTTIVLL